MFNQAPPLLALTLSTILIANTTAPQNPFIQRITSPEVIAVIIGSLGGWGLSELHKRNAEAKEKEVELGRLKFRQEILLGEKAAISEGIQSVHNAIDPKIAGLYNDIKEIREDLKQIKDTSLKTLENCYHRHQHEEP